MLIYQDDAEVGGRRDHISKREKCNFDLIPFDGFNKDSVAEGYQQSSHPCKGIPQHVNEDNNRCERLGGEPRRITMLIDQCEKSAFYKRYGHDDQNIILHINSIRLILFHQKAPVNEHGTVDDGHKWIVGEVW